MKKRLLSILLTACLLMGLLPTVALAEGGVKYLDDKGVEQTCTENYTTITATNPPTAWGTSRETTWYVVQGTVEIGSRVTVSGDVHLILADNCNFTVNGGIQVQDNDNDINNGSDNALTIYAQSTGSTMGKLTANTGGGNAGIGGDSGGSSGSGFDGGTITINGGTVTAKCGGGGAGIGGGFGDRGNGRCGEITINGGTVTATSTDYGAGIGSGAHCLGASLRSGGKITITSGIVTATGKDGAGIGGGLAGDGCTITISGGTVTATSTDYGAGIGGGGNNAGSGNSGGEITISGGTGKATGKYGAGIGGGGGDYGGDGGKITISGGTVEATSTFGAGIGGGGVYGSGSGGAGGTITISGGTVTATATGTYSGAGIGGGGGGFVGGDGGTITISGGTVTATATATGTYSGAGIGGGCGTSGGAGGEITITGGTVKATAKSKGAGIGGGSGTNGGDGGTFQTQKTGEANGNAVIFANSIGDTSGKDSGAWSGIIFEGSSDGKVYGTEVAPTDDFTIEAAKTLIIGINQSLTIPEGVTMTNNGTVNNSGTIYVDGTLTGAVSGNVYYHLALTSCTATGDPSLETHDAKTYATAESEITLTPVTPTGYQFESWTVSGADVTVENNKFTMPASAVTVTAEFVYTPSVIPTSYRIAVAASENGTVTSNRNYAYGGTTITLTVTPDEGYELGELTVTDAAGKAITVTDKGDGTFTFKLPYGNVKVAATFVAKPDPVKDCTKDENCPAAKFTDVKMDWTHDGIHFCVVNGLMNGTSDDTFEPEGNTARAMLVTVLYRLEGEPEVGECTFSDVPADQWYTDAVTWAAENKIVEGYDGKFKPTDDITRQEFATILYRYAVYKGYDVSIGEDTNILSFDDAEEISSWAVEAMQWAVGAGLFEGKGENNLDPTGKTTRAEMAAILYRFCENVVE